MLSTSDNKFNPFTHEDEWRNFDVKEKGYNTESYLAQIAYTSDDFSDEMNARIIEDAIDDAVRVNIIGLLTNNKVNYVKVVC